MQLAEGAYESFIETSAWVVVDPGWSFERHNGVKRMQDPDGTFEKDGDLRFSAFFRLPYNSGSAASPKVV